MNAKILALDVVLTAFLALTGYVVFTYGYLGFFDWALHNAATTLLFIDLSISLTLILFWMWGDARQHGLSIAPWVVLTLGFGAAGPLGYLIRRELHLRASPGRAVPARA